MKYNRDKTLNHIISQTYTSCVKDFNQVVLNEDNSLIVIPNYFINTFVLDLDCVELKEAQNCKRNQNKTMDCAFAICEDELTEMLLVELRFNYINMLNLSRLELIGKVLGSRNILGNSIPIKSKYIFIFQNNLTEQAKNRFQRMNPRIPNEYVAMNLNDLIAEYF